MFSSITPAAGSPAACSLSVAQLNAINVGGGCTSNVSRSTCTANISCGGELNETLTVSGHSFTGTIVVDEITYGCSYDVAGTVQ